MLTAVKLGFVKRARSETGMNQKVAESLFESLVNNFSSKEDLDKALNYGKNMGAMEMVNKGDDYLRNMAESITGHGSEVARASAAGFGAAGGGLAGALAGGFTGRKEDTLKDRLKRALGFGAVGAIGGGLGGALGGSIGGQDAARGGLQAGQHALHNGFINTIKAK